MAGPALRSLFRRAAALGAAAVVGWVAVANFDDFVGRNLAPEGFAEVVPGQIYRSRELTPAALAKVVRAHEIKTIVDLGAWDLESRANRRERRTALALEVQRARVRNHTGDLLGQVNSYAQALRFMTAAPRRPVLVHCGSHTGHTARVIALYRMLREGWTVEQACAEADAIAGDAGDGEDLRGFLAMWSGPIRESLATGEPVTEAPLGAAQIGGGVGGDQTGG